jgi:hypothetical protein
METLIDDLTIQKSYQKKGTTPCKSKGWEPSKSHYKVIRSYVTAARLPENQYFNWISITSCDWVKRNERDFVTIEIFGKTYSLLSSLQNIASAINESKWINNLKEDWDYEGAVPIDKELYISAINFLIDYSTEIFKKTGLVISTPEINPCKDGSIDLSWRTSAARMLINIRKIENELLAYYYGDFYSNKSQMKGNVHLDSVYEHLATWMKSLL